MRIVPYILKGQVQSGDWSHAFEQLHLDSLNDRLADNYSGTKLNLDKMYNFTFTYGVWFGVWFGVSKFSFE